MARTITAALETETLAEALAPIVLVELDFASGFVRVWSGYGDLTFDGDVYQGTGNLGSVGAIEESSRVIATGTTFQLSGIPSELLAIALGEHYQGRPAKMWLGALNLTTGALVADPYLLFSGRMDQMVIQEGGETSTIALTAENRLIDLERERERRLTPEDQHALFPGDKGLDFQPLIQDREVFWGTSGPTNDSLSHPGGIR